MTKKLSKSLKYQRNFLKPSQNFKQIKLIRAKQQNSSRNYNYNCSSLKLKVQKKSTGFNNRSKPNKKQSQNKKAKLKAFTNKSNYQQRPTMKKIIKF